VAELSQSVDNVAHRKSVVMETNLQKILQPNTAQEFMELNRGAFFLGSAFTFEHKFIQQ